MLKEMSNEQFINCSTIGHGDIYNINKKMEDKGIINIKDQIEYIRKNNYGQEYLYFALKELDNVILKNYHGVSDNFVFSKDAIDGVLRSFMFAMQYMQEGLPQHAYNYIEGKSGSFFRELLEQYKEQNII